MSLPLDRSYQDGNVEVYLDGFRSLLTSSTFIQKKKKKKKKKKKERKKKCRGNSSAPYRGEGFRGDHHAVKTTR